MHKFAEFCKTRENMGFKLAIEASFKPKVEWFLLPFIEWWSYYTKDDYGGIAKQSASTKISDVAVNMPKSKHNRFAIYREGFDYFQGYFFCSPWLTPKNNFSTSNLP